MKIKFGSYQDAKECFRLGFEKLLRELTLEQFTGGTFRNLSHKSNGLRTFVVSQLLAAVRNNLVFARTNSIFQDDESGHLFAVKRVWYTDGCGRGHRGMF